MKITCLTVTQDIRRLPLLQKSISCYCNQTYSDKAMLIVSDGSEAYARRIDELLQRLGRDDIRHLYVPGKRSLGEIRNISVARADSPYLCQWDDDDLNHPKRLEIQFEDMVRRGGIASLMEDQLQLFYDTRELLWISWRPDLIPGTLLCHHDCLTKYPYPNFALGEDACIRERLREREALVTLSGVGYLNMYTYSGLNVYPRRHHKQIRFSHDPGFVMDRIDVLERELPVYELSLSDLKLVGTGGKVMTRFLSRLRRAARKQVNLARSRLLNGGGALPG